MAAFNDERIFYKSQVPDCDNCHVEELSATDSIDKVPMIRDVSLAITLAYEPYAPQKDRPTKIRKLPIIRPKISQDRMNLVQSDIREWRKNLAGLEDFTYVRPFMVLSDDTITTVIEKLRQLGSEEDLKDILAIAGHRFPSALITPHISSLFRCIFDSLSKSEPVNSNSGQPKITASKRQSDPKIPLPAYIPTPVTAPNANFQSDTQKWAIPPIVPRPVLGEVQTGDPRLNGVIRNANVSAHSHTMSTTKIRIDLKRIREDDPDWYASWNEGKRARKIHEPSRIIVRRYIGG